MMNEAKRHHYIPQFILRNFCFDKSRTLLNYYDKNTKKTSIKHSKDVFMDIHLYRDEINHQNQPTAIETDLAEFERVVAPLISKIVTEKEVTLTYEENELLKLFFALMGFRAQNTAQFFSEAMSKDSKVFYSNYQKDRNMNDLWKRNLGFITNCRSLQEVMTHPDIDEPFKVFFMRDTFGYFGKYFSVVECIGAERFIIGDTYPTVITGYADVHDIPMVMYEIFPLSPTRVLLFVSNGATGTPRDVLDFRPCVIMPPVESDGFVTIRIKRFFDEETKRINSHVFKEARIGVAYKNHTIAQTEC